jgi:hypothetical protein
VPLGRPVHQTSALLAVRHGPWNGSGLVRVGVRPQQHVLALPPDSPLLVVHPERGPQLLAAAGLLHAQMRRDAAGRRRPAHRDSQPTREYFWLYHRHRFDVRKEMPDEQRSRDWRLGGDPSLRHWLAVRGHDVRDRPDL